MLASTWRNSEMDTSQEGASGRISLALISEVKMTARKNDESRPGKQITAGSTKLRSCLLGSGSFRGVSWTGYETRGQLRMDQQLGGERRQGMRGMGKHRALERRPLHARAIGDRKCWLGVGWSEGDGLSSSGGRGGKKLISLVGVIVPSGSVLRTWWGWLGCFANRCYFGGEDKGMEGVGVGEFTNNTGHIKPKCFENDVHMGVGRHSR
eukprot:767873-Hanusia_phi.AAC.4